MLDFFKALYTGEGILCIPGSKQLDWKEDKGADLLHDIIHLGKFFTVILLVTPNLALQETDSLPCFCCSPIFLYR